MEIEYKNIKNKYEKEIKEIMKELKLSSSKNKNSKPEDLIWKFEWCIKAVPLIYKTLDEKLDQEIKRIDGVNLIGTIGKFYRSYSLNNIPDEVIETYKKEVSKQPIQENNLNLTKISLMSDNETIFFVLSAYQNIKTGKKYFIIRRSDNTKELLISLNEKEKTFEYNSSLSFITIKDRLEQVNSGDIIKYRNINYKKLSNSEINKICQKKYEQD